MGGVTAVIETKDLGRRYRKLWALAGWVLFQAGLRLGIDLCWPQLRDPTFEIKARRLARLIAGSPEPPLTVLMVGSSVTSNAFKASHLERLLAGETGLDHDHVTWVILANRLGAEPGIPPYIPKFICSP